jgi:hypothetical protein
MRCALLSTLLFIFMLAPAHSEGGGARCKTCARNAWGRIKRNPEARRAFQKSNPCPSTGKRSGGCSGYVVDHVKPLKRGGADAPSNMQWQTKADAKAKDRIE